MASFQRGSNNSCRAPERRSLGRAQFDPWRPFKIVPVDGRYETKRSMAERESCPLQAAPLVTPTSKNLNSTARS